MALNYQVVTGFADTLVIEGTSTAGEQFRVTNPVGTPVVAVTDVIFSRTITDTSSLLGMLLINTLGGDDLVTVDVNSPTSDVIGIPITFDGGLGSDRLIVSGTPATAVDEVIYTPGSAIAAGQLRYEDAANAVLMTIDFVNIEPTTDFVPAALLTVKATNADNAINYTQGSVAANGLVSVDGFETLEFSNKTTLTINALAGGDEINLNNSSTPTGLAGITVNGDDPTGSDRLIVNGTAVAGTVSVDVSTQTITGAAGSGVTITYGTIEHLTVVAGVSTTLSVSGASSSVGIDYTLTPGSTADRGDIETIAVPISFIGFGAGSTLNFDGDTFDGNDELTILGTNQNDSFSVAGTTGTVTYTGRATVTQTNIEELVIDGLNGDDQFTVAGNHPYDSIAIHGGDPLGSDVLFLTGAAAAVESVTISPDAANPTEQDVTGLGGTINVSGVELLRYTGADTDDTLTVELGDGDNTAHIERGDNADQVISDSLSPIEFSGLSTFVIASGDGADVVTFKTHDLAGALPGNYRFFSGSATTLVIEGEDGATSDAADDFLVTNPTGVALVAVKDQNSGVTVTGGTTGFLGRLQINTLGRDDTVTVDVSAPSDVISVPITFDGGLGTDQLIVSGSPATTVDEVIYTPGPLGNQGRLRYENAVDAVLMIIDFLNLEPVLDTLTAAKLTVNGTNADNAINYGFGSSNDVTTGVVSVDGFETIEFANKTTLTIDALAGSDEINLNNSSTPTGLDRDYGQRQRSDGQRHADRKRHGRSRRWPSTLQRRRSRERLGRE